MHMIKKKQRQVGVADEGRSAAELFYALAAESPAEPEGLPLKAPLVENVRHSPQNYG